MSSAEASATIHLGRSHGPGPVGYCQELCANSFADSSEWSNACKKENPPRNLGGHIDVGVTYFHGQSPGNYRRRS